MFLGGLDEYANVARVVDNALRKLNVIIITLFLINLRQTIYEISFVLLCLV